MKASASSSAPPASPGCIAFTAITVDFPTRIFEAGNPINITNEANPRGDYNQDNSGADRPNAPAASVKRSGFERADYLRGIFAVADFPTPTLGTNGTLGRNRFRGPGGLLRPQPC